jgi:hypothetical protein
MDTDLAFKLAELRGQIAELGSSIRQLQKAGMDSASAQLLITRKRAELEHLMNSNGATATRQPAVDKGACRRSARAGRGWECNPSFHSRASGASEQDPRASKVSDEEGHAQHQRDAYNDDEDKEPAHPYSSMR